MRCKKHFSDSSSAAGVCASCLRERLLAVIETQSKHQAKVLLVKPQLEDEHRKSDAVEQHITFPKSVSPYISRRKSDATAAWPHLPDSVPEQRFYTTPQIGPNGIIMTAKSSLRESRAGKFQFSGLSNLFRSKTLKFESESDLNFDTRTKHQKSNSINSTMTETPQKPPSSWFTNLFTSKKKRNSHKVSMSFPEYSSPKNTPMRATPQGRKQNQGRNMGGLSLCLSPLVRPRPNRRRSWNEKGVVPEMVIQELSPGRPNFGAAASNRSRKLANYGRFHHNY